MSKKRRNNPDDSSDEEVESESPLDEDHRPMYPKSFMSGQPTLSLVGLRERRPRRDSVSRSDTSGSSAGDLDITPCNASPHLPSMLTFRPPRDETEENWRRSMLSLLQPSSSYPPTLLNQLYRLVRELTDKCVQISKDCVKYFTGSTVSLGNRISILSDLLSSREEPPRVWYNENSVMTPRLAEALRYSVLEIQEHLETFFDRKDHVLENLDSVKSSVKFNLFTDDTLNDGASTSEQINQDPGVSEMLIDLGRSLYKLMFQLLLLIEADHKIAIQVHQDLLKNEVVSCLCFYVRWIFFHQTFHWNSMFKNRKQTFSSADAKLFREFHVNQRSHSPKHRWRGARVFGYVHIDRGRKLDSHSVTTSVANEQMWLWKYNLRAGW